MNTIAFKLPNSDNSSKYLNAIIETIREYYPKMTINGIHNLPGNRHIAEGISFANKGAIIVISSENTFDVDWYTNEDTARKDGISFIMELDRDYHRILDMIKSYYNYHYNNVFKNAVQGKTVKAFDTEYARKTFGTYANSETEVYEFDAYVRIGNKVFPKFAPRNTQPKTFNAFSFPTRKYTPVKKGSELVIITNGFDSVSLEMN